jgi:hypothetical protein
MLELKYVGNAIAKWREIDVRLTWEVLSLTRTCLCQASAFMWSLEWLLATLVTWDWYFRVEWLTTIVKSITGYLLDGFAFHYDDVDLNTWEYKDKTIKMWYSVVRENMKSMWDQSKIRLDGWYGWWLGTNRNINPICVIWIYVMCLCMICKTWVIVMMSWKRLNKWRCFTIYKMKNFL